MHFSFLVISAYCDSSKLSGACEVSHMQALERDATCDLEFEEMRSLVKVWPSEIIAAFGMHQSNSRSSTNFLSNQAVKKQEMSSKRAKTIERLLKCSLKWTWPLPTTLKESWWFSHSHHSTTMVHIAKSRFTADWEQGPDTISIHWFMRSMWGRTRLPGRLPSKRASLSLSPPPRIWTWATRRRGGRALCMS